MITVTVDLADLHKMSDLICEVDCDNRHKPSTQANIGRMHALIMKMAGEHVNEIYLPDDIAIEIQK